MKFRKQSGQEATEFALITVLVFFSALLVVFMFGGKLSKFFSSESSTVKVANNPSYAITQNFQSKYKTEIENYTGPTKTVGAQGRPADPPVNIITLGGQQVTENPDGTLSFTVSGQNVIISTQMKDLANTVFQTTGTTGANDLIKEIAYMIEKHKAEYPGTNVPVDVIMGAGDRNSTSCGSIGYVLPTNLCSGYGGTAVVDSFAIKVGNDLVITQNDQKCVKNIYGTSGCNYKGKYRIEGAVDNNNKLVDSNVEASNTNVRLQSAVFNATIDLSNGINISNSSLTTQSYAYGPTQPLYEINYNWNFSFDSINNSFSI